MDKLETGAGRLGLTLNPAQIEQFETYYREMQEWNRRVNLTAITDYEEVQVNHFLDSLTVVQALDRTETGKDLRIIDVGSGAGMPGLPLKIILPDIKLVLLEATAKKVTFLHHIRDMLGLKNVEILTGRAEEIAHTEGYREGFTTVLSRAVAPLAALVELTLPFCQVGGTFIAQKKGDTGQELEQAEKAIEKLGGSLREIKRIELEEFTDERYLVIIDKVSTTPEKYPRRPGIPEKRPIK